MFGVRRWRRFLWLRCGIAIWLVITAGILVMFHLQFDPVTDLQNVINDYFGCQRLANKTLQMVSSSRKTLVKSPYYDTVKIKRVCAWSSYGLWKDLPRASVIITFHDTETIYSLLHTIHSVIQRTPCILLQEIIVIDDFSKKEELGQVLDIYMRTTFSKQVKLFRNSENIGLIRSRLKGARLSQGDVIVFMDSHSEVQPAWLEPLLYEIKKDRKTLAHSFIDWMSKPNDVWEYKIGGANWITYFDWSLVFGWQSHPKEAKRKVTDPIRIKAIIGAYAAIDRGFFGEIGELDEGMEFWGGENIDLSIRVWLFGGRVVGVPCSRVAHLEGAHSRDYRVKFMSIIRRNYKRLVEVWFDEYKTYFYLYYPDLISVDAGNLEERLKVKARAMHNFSWYLQNVYPELGLPDRDSFAWGRLRNVRRRLCFDARANLQLYWCSSSSNYKNQLFYWSKKFELRQPIHIVNFISEMKVGERLNRDQYIPFYGNDLGTKWIHWKNGPMMEDVSGLCLSAVPDSMNVTMVLCDYENDPDQVWEFEHYTNQYFDTIRGNNRSIENQYKKLLSKLLSLKSDASKPSIVALSEEVPGNRTTSSSDFIH